MREPTDAPFDALMQDPCQGDRDQDGEQCRRPISQLIGLDIDHHEVQVQQISFQADRAEESPEGIEPFRHAPEYPVEHQYCGNGKGDIDHPLDVEWELPMGHLLQVKRGTEGHHEGKDQHPDTRAVDFFLLPDHLSEVDADEEDGDPTPEYLQMPYGMMDGWYPLYQDAP